jgi:thioredoxin-related protein
MKIFLLVPLLAFAAISLHAQLWQTNFSTALDTAKQQEKNLVLVFSGSDWCAPCIRLDREVWTDTSFIAAAPEHLVFYKADFPRRKTNRLSEALQESHARLAERYNRKGSFPFVVVLNPEGEILGEMGYRNVPALEYLSTLESF